jgi:hypothetical protein
MFGRGSAMQRELMARAVDPSLNRFPAGKRTDNPGRFSWRTHPAKVRAVVNAESVPQHRPG